MLSADPLKLRSWSCGPSNLCIVGRIQSMPAGVRMYMRVSDRQQRRGKCRGSELCVYSVLLRSKGCLIFILCPAWATVTVAQHPVVLHWRNGAPGRRDQRRKYRRYGGSLDNGRTVLDSSIGGPQKHRCGPPRCCTYRGRNPGRAGAHGADCGKRDNIRHSRRRQADRRGQWTSTESRELQDKSSKGFQWVVPGDRSIHRPGRPDKDIGFIFHLARGQPDDRHASVR